MDIVDQMPQLTPDQQMSKIAELMQTTVEDLRDQMLVK